MADVKKDEKKAEKVETKAPAAEPVEIVQSRGMPLADDDAMQALLDKANSALATLDKAKDADFQKLELDFWKPEKDGDELKGVYLGSTKNGNYLQHHIGRKGKDGKPVKVTVNGTITLTKAFRQIDPGTAVSIKFVGMTKTNNGMNLRQYDVRFLR